MSLFITKSANVAGRRLRYCDALELGGGLPRTVEVDSYLRIVREARIFLQIFA